MQTSFSLLSSIGIFQVRTFNVPIPCPYYAHNSFFYDHKRMNQRSKKTSKHPHSTTHKERIQLNHSDSSDASMVKPNKHASSTNQKNSSTSCLTWHFLSKMKCSVKQNLTSQPSIMIPSYKYIR
ncbi:hypothetical protein ACB098_01G058700 [Castanea mollissima]